MLDTLDLQSYGVKGDVSGRIEINRNLPGERKPGEVDVEEDVVLSDQLDWLSGQRGYLHNGSQVAVLALT